MKYIEKQPPGHLGLVCFSSEPPSQHLNFFKSVFLTDKLIKDKGSASFHFISFQRDMSLRLVGDLVASLALDKEEVNLLEAIFICRAGEH